eukprot:1672537-Alexandrium_andersonii.AAC.1
MLHTWCAWLRAPNVGGPSKVVGEHVASSDKYARNFAASGNDRRLSAPATCAAPATGGAEVARGKTAIEELIGI